MTKKIVIVGGGFAGVKAALELSKRGVGKITLISDESYFLHHATLYATATGRNIAESVISLKDIFSGHQDVTVVKDFVIDIDAKRQVVIGKHSEHAYDEVIFALGSVTTFFNITGMAQHAYGIKSLDEIKKFRLHMKTEILEGALDKEYVVIGAGSTGVELAGALQDYINELGVKHKLKSQTRVTLVEAASRILPHASTTAAKIVSKRLKKQNIRVLAGQKVELLDKDYIRVDGKKISTRTAIWTSGVANNPFFGAHEDLFKLTPQGRVIVDGLLQARPHVYVIGDNNSIKYSGTAWAALRQADFIAKHLSRQAKNAETKKFKPRSAALGIPVGDSWGYVEWLGIYVAGKSGYAARRLIELRGYCQLLPFKKAVAVWRAHDLPQVDE